MPKNSAIAKVASNVIEGSREPLGDLERQTFKGLSRDLAQMLYGGHEAVKTEEQMEQIERQDRMMKNEVYSRHLQELGIMQGKNIEEITITPTQREEIETVHESYSKFEQQQRETAKNLGVENPNIEEQEKNKKDELEAQERAREEAEERQRLETQIEAPPGKITGLSFKRKKSASRMQRPPKSAETRASRGVGG